MRASVGGASSTFQLVFVLLLMVEAMAHAEPCVPVSAAVAHSLNGAHHSCGFLFCWLAMCVAAVVRWCMSIAWCGGTSLRCGPSVKRAKPRTRRGRRSRYRAGGATKHASFARLFIVLAFSAYLCLRAGRAHQGANGPQSVAGNPCGDLGLNRSAVSAVSLNVSTLCTTHIATPMPRVSSRLANSSCSAQLDWPHEVALRVGCGCQRRRCRVDRVPFAVAPCCSSQMHRPHGVALRDGCGCRNRCYRFGAMCSDDARLGYSAVCAAPLGGQNNYATITICVSSAIACIINEFGGQVALHSLVISTISCLSPRVCGRGLDAHAAPLRATRGTYVDAILHLQWPACDTFGGDADGEYATHIALVHAARWVGGGRKPFARACNFGNLLGCRRDDFLRLNPAPIADSPARMTTTSSELVSCRGSITADGIILVYRTTDGEPYGVQHSCSTSSAHAGDRWRQPRRSTQCRQLRDRYHNTDQGTNDRGCPPHANRDGRDRVGDDGNERRMDDCKEMNERASEHVWNGPPPLGRCPPPPGLPPPVSDICAG